MMVYLLGFVLLALLIAAVVYAITSSEDRYARMTEEEFEEDAKRTSMTGAGLLGLESIFDPKKAEFLLQQDKRVEGEQSPSGDRPDTSTDASEQGDDSPGREPQR
jgi:hypothetical protein